MEIICSYLPVLALILTFVASFLLIRGNLMISSTDLAELSKSKGGYNKEVLVNLTRQQADTKVGAVLLFLSLILQLININISWPLRLAEFKVDISRIIISIVIAGFCYLIANCVSNKIQSKLYNDTLQIIQQK